jgi:aminoglycoside phosphotransferase (APT) family kinase protein
LPTGGLVELASELSSELSRSEEPLVASHGDYHPKNVLSDGSTISVIDLDKLAEREASFDCGDAIAQLLIMSYYTFSSTERGMIAARAFWRRYARLSGASPTRTAMHICRAVIHALAFKHALGLRAQSPVPGLAEWTSLVVAVADDRDPESIIEKSAALAT